jgi:multiple sugar transport system substrate-binding protein
MNERITRRTALKRLAVIGGAASVALRGGLSASAGGARPAPVMSRASEEGGTLRYLYNATPGPNEKVYLDMIDLYEKRYPGVKVEKIRVPGELEIVQKMLAMLAANDPPELFLNRQRTATPFISRGVVFDMTPLATADKIDLKDFWPSAIQTYGGGKALYGLPFGASSNAFYYNVDAYKKAGVPLPTELAKSKTWNWDTLLDQTKKLTSGDGPGKQFGIDPIVELDHIDMWIWQNGGKLWDLDAKESYFNAPEAVGAIQFLVDMVRKDKVMPTPDQNNSDGEFFAAGRVGIRAAGRFILQSIEESKFEVGMVVAPNGPKTNKTRGDDLAHSIPIKSKRQDLGWNFAKLWTSDDGQKIVLTTRRSYTARRSFAESEWMKENLLPWEDQQTYIEGLERTGVYEAPGRANEVEAIFSRELGLAYLGEKSVKEATDTMKQDIDVVLKKPV